MSMEKRIRQDPKRYADRLAGGIWCGSLLFSTMAAALYPPKTLLHPVGRKGYPWQIPVLAVAGSFIGAGAVQLAGPLRQDNDLE